MLSVSLTQKVSLFQVTLSVSRDGGRSFHYVSREAVLSPGLAGTWSAKRVWVLPTPYQEGETQTVAYAAYNVDENARIDGPVQASGLAASRGRLDGMSALATTGFGQVGEALTMPVRFTGSSLELNVDCGGHGWVMVEVVDEAGSPPSSEPPSRARSRGGQRGETPLSSGRTEK